MAPAAEDDGLCWWCCDCDDAETCPHPVARCSECAIDEGGAEGWDEWFAGDDDE